MEVSIIGLDLAKTVFQAHGADAHLARLFCANSFAGTNSLNFSPGNRHVLSLWKRVVVRIIGRVRSANWATTCA